MKKLLVGVLLLAVQFSWAQQDDHLVSWKMEIKSVDGKDNMKTVNISAEIKDGWQLYSNDFDPNLGPMVTEFMYVKNNDFELVQGTIPQDSKRKYDDLWGGEYAYFEHNALFIQEIEARVDKPDVKCVISYQVCNSVDGKCIPFEYTLIPLNQ